MYVLFDINGVETQNVGLSIKYLGVNLILCNNVLTIDVEDRIRKFKIELEINCKIAHL